jgi:hypothetical protein
MADAEHVRLVEREDVAVMFKRVADEQAAISSGWAEVEEAVGSLRGRKFYGVVDGAGDEYRVCVRLRDGDEPDALGLEMACLPVAAMRRCAFKGSRRPSTNGSRLRLRGWHNGPTVIRVARASSSTGGAT